MPEPWDGVAIIGAGTAGLAIAVALQQQGVRARIYEQASRFGDVGAGIALKANSLRVLDQLGLIESIGDVASPTPGGMVIYHGDGARIGGPMAGRSDGRMVALHRADLVAVLVSALAPDTIRFGAKVVGIDQDDDGVTLRFEDGNEERVGAVVGADGIHSVVRDAVVPGSPSVFSGMITYRGLVPADRVPDWPLDEARTYTGPDRHLVVYPVRRFELLNFAATMHADEPVKESWSAEGDPGDLVKIYGDWDGQVQRFVGTIERTFRWGLYDREPLPTWAKGRIALAGDAAHPMLPHAGEGATQAIEDAAALAAVLGQRPHTETAEAFAEYDRARRARGSYVQLYSRRIGLEYDHRDQSLAGRTDLADKNEITSWLLGHDARAVAQRVRQGGEPDPVPVGAPV